MPEQGGSIRPWSLCPVGPSEELAGQCVRWDNKQTGQTTGVIQEGSSDALMSKPALHRGEPIPASREDPRVLRTHLGPAAPPSERLQNPSPTHSGISCQASQRTGRHLPRRREGGRVEAPQKCAKDRSPYLLKRALLPQSQEVQVVLCRLLRPARKRKGGWKLPQRNYPSGWEGLRSV